MAARGTPSDTAVLLPITAPVPWLRSLHSSSAEYAFRTLMQVLLNWLKPADIFGGMIFIRTILAEHIYAHGMTLYL